MSKQRPNALVTGAASGIGAATVRRLTRDGVSGFVLIDRDESALLKLAADLGAGGLDILPILQDVSDARAWEITEAAIRDRFGALDHAVASAGVTDGGAIADFPIERWRKLMSINLDGVFLTLQCAMRLMKPAGGSIVVVSSVAGVKAAAGAGAYGVAKAAVTHLTKVAAKEGAPDGIRVNAILPGGVKTPLWNKADFFKDLIAEHGSEAAAYEAMAKSDTPIGRYAEPEEIADQIALMLSERSSFMTGAALVMDGGYSL